MGYDLEFYGANTQTPYPFVGPYDELTSQIVDAQITTPNGSVGGIRLVRYRNVSEQPALIELADDNGVFLSGVSVVVADFGAYKIWQAESATAAVTLVVAKEAVSIDYTGAGYEFVSHVVSSPVGTMVTQVNRYTGGFPSSTIPVASAGQLMSLAATGQMSLSLEYSESGPIITLSANPRSASGGAGSDCVQPTETSAAYISTINGIGPSAQGNFKLRGIGVWTVDSVEGGARLVNTGRECCTCEDYVEMFRRLQITNERLRVTRDWIVNNQYRYKVLLEYTKFLLRHEIVGGIDPNAPDTRMTCEQ